MALFIADCKTHETDNNKAKTHTKSIPLSQIFQHPTGCSNRKIIFENITCGDYVFDIGFYTKNVKITKTGNKTKSMKIAKDNATSDQKQNEIDLSEHTAHQILTDMNQSIYSINRPITKGEVRLIMSKKYNVDEQLLKSHKPYKKAWKKFKILYTYQKESFKNILEKTFVVSISHQFRSRGTKRRASQSVDNPANKKRKLNNSHAQSYNNCSNEHSFNIHDDPIISDNLKILFTIHIGSVDDQNPLTKHYTQNFGAEKLSDFIVDTLCSLFNRVDNMKECIYIWCEMEINNIETLFENKITQLDELSNAMDKLEKHNEHLRNMYENEKQKNEKLVVSNLKTVNSFEEYKQQIEIINQNLNLYNKPELSLLSMQFDELEQLRSNVVKKFKEMERESLCEIKTLNEKLCQYNGTSESINKNRLDLLQLGDLELELSNGMQRIRESRQRLIESRDICVACRYHHKNIVFLDGCSHIAICRMCENKLDVKQCPICRTPYTRVREMNL